MRLTRLQSRFREPWLEARWLVCTMWLIAGYGCAPEEEHRQVILVAVDGLSMETVQHSPAESGLHGLASTGSLLVGYTSASSERSGVAMLLTGQSIDDQQIARWEGRLPESIQTVGEVIEKHGVPTAAFFQYAPSVDYERGWDYLVNQDSTGGASQVISAARSWAELHGDSPFFLFAFVGLASSIQELLASEYQDGRLSAAETETVYNSVTTEFDLEMSRLHSQVQDRDTVLILVATRSSEHFGPDVMEEGAVADRQVPIVLHGVDIFSKLDSSVSVLRISPTIVEHFGVSCPANFTEKSLFR